MTARMLGALLAVVCAGVVTVGFFVWLVLGGAPPIERPGSPSSQTVAPTGKTP